MNRKPLVLDIETIPNLDVIHLLPEPEVALGNLVDPVKIEAKKSEAKKKQIASMGLSPLTGKVACIGLHMVDGGRVIIGGDEGDVLTEAYNAINADVHLFTFNGKAFDLPFIFKRGIILRLPWATIANMKRFTDRYKAIWHTDLMEEFCNYGERVSLDNLARFILGSKKTERDYSEYVELIKTEEGRQKIADDCLCDCKLTWDLAERMGYFSA